MFFQEATPDTTGYMIAAYAITFIILAVYVTSLYVRNRNLQRDLETLAELERAVPAAQPVTNAKAKK